MSAARSKRLASGAIPAAGGYVTVYTCPTGKTALCKTLYVTNLTGANALIAVNASHGGVFTPILINLATPNNTVLTMPYPITLGAGDLFRIWSSSVAGGGCLYWLSGSELEA